MCDGSMTSMIPVVTNRVFGVKRGPMVYSYIFSTFGVAAMLGALLVKTMQTNIGFTGMLIICLAFTLVSATITYFYIFKRISYLELAEKVGFVSEDRTASKFGMDQVSNILGRQSTVILTPGNYK